MYVQMFVGLYVCVVYVYVSLINILLIYWGRVSDLNQGSQIWLSWLASLFQGSHLGLLNPGITGRPPNPPSMYVKVQNPNLGLHTVTALTLPSDLSPHPSHPSPQLNTVVLSSCLLTCFSPAHHPLLLGIFHHLPSLPSPCLPSTNCLFEWQ